MDTIKNFTNNQRSWRYRIFAITWFAYAGFYFGRKNFSVAMPSMANELGYSHQDLAMVISAFSFTYMAGQFLNGFLADRFSPRVIVGIGLIMAAIANFFMGWTGTLSVFIFLMGVNGLAQSTGWPGLLKNMSAWFGQKERGVVLSWWSTCYVVGAFGATIFATYCITSDSFFPELTWSKGFFGPAILLFFMALCYLLITRDTPEQARIQNLHREHAEKVSNKDKAVQNFELEKLKGVLGSSSLWATASMYFFLKMTRYAFLFWLPIYMVEALGYENEMAGYMSSAYELAGFFGILLAGYVSDKFFNSRRFPVATVMLFGLAFSCLMLPLLSDISMIATLASIALIGMMTYGPDSLMSATGAIDIGGENGAATAVGVINGIGSMGQLISPFVVTFFSKTYGWDGLFYFFVGLSLISSLILLLKWRS